MGPEVVDEAMAVETGLEEEVEEAARESLEALEVELEEVATAEDQEVRIVRGTPLGFHPRNKYRGSYDFDALIRSLPALARAMVARPATGATLSQPATSAHDATTSTFFLRESQSVKSSSGRQMASGRPGKPPPLPFIAPPTHAADSPTPHLLQ